MNLNSLIRPLLVFLCGLIKLSSKFMMLATMVMAMAAGEWVVIQTVLGILSTFAIITNSALVGFTSNSFYYYFPTMAEVGGKIIDIQKN